MVHQFEGLQQNPGFYCSLLQPNHALCSVKFNKNKTLQSFSDLLSPWKILLSLLSLNSARVVKSTVFVQSLRLLLKVKTHLLKIKYINYSLFTL